MWEAMVAELRATQADVDNRRHFTPEKKPIMDARSMIEQWLTPAAEISPEMRSAQSAKSMNQAAEFGSIEMG